MMKDRFEEFKFDVKKQLRVSELGAFAADDVVDFYFARSFDKSEYIRTVRGVGYILG